MRIRVSLYTLAFLLLSGCVTKPDLILFQDPISIASDDLEKYWIPKGGEFNLFIPTNSMPSKGMSGFVKIRYLIDSNGNVFYPKIVESKPKRIFNRVARKVLRKMKFEKAKSNPDAIPVYVTTEIKFEQ